MQDDVRGGAVALVVHDVGVAEHAALPEGPLGELRHEELVARAALIAIAAHRGPEKLVGEQIQRTGEDNARVVPCLHRADQQGLLSGALRVVSDGLIRARGVGCRAAREHLHRQHALVIYGVADAVEKHPRC